VIIVVAITVLFNERAAKRKFEDLDSPPAPQPRKPDIVGWRRDDDSERG
jgi:hypothetical protein